MLNYKKANYAHTWVKDVIDSCENELQLRTANKLAHNFFDTYKDSISMELMNDMIKTQKDMITNKHVEFMNTNF